MNIETQEIGKYRKKKDSNKSKSKEKSNHKHDYKECLLRMPFSNDKTKFHTEVCSYCSICGKIGEKVKDSIVDFGNQKPFMISFSCRGEEIYEKYKDKLPVFETEGFFDKYVKLK